MMSSKLSEGEEADTIGRCLDAIASASGQRPTGWIGQDYGQSARTPKLLAGAGLDYVCDWPNDDVPYLMTYQTPSGRPLVSLPNQAEWDDVQMLAAPQGRDGALSRHYRRGLRRAACRGEPLGALAHVHPRLDARTGVPRSQIGVDVVAKTPRRWRTHGK